MSRVQFLKKSTTMASVFSSKSPAKIRGPKRSTTRRKLDMLDEADQFTPQRAAFIWLKLVHATRDIGDEANMASMNEKQWQIALNQYHVNIEPGLSKKIFLTILNRKGKHLFQTDFVGFVERQLENRSVFDSRAEMTSDELNAMGSPDDNPEVLDVLASKIVYALLEGVPLDVFELLKTRLNLATDATVEELITQMSEVEWHHRMEIMEHIAKNENIVLTQQNCELILANWANQFSDERSQLVRVALETCPILVNRMFIEGIHVDVSRLLDGLVVPVRAKRSKELQRLGSQCGQDLMKVFLGQFREEEVKEDENDEETKEIEVDGIEQSGASMESLLLTIETLCAKILENTKYEIVRKVFLSLIILLIAFHKESEEAVMIFESESTTRQIVSVLDVTLADKKPEVRNEAFRFMRLLDKILNGNPNENVRDSVEANVWQRIDPSARSRFERQRKRKFGRARSVKLRNGAIGRGGVSIDDAFAGRQRGMRPHMRSTSVPVEMTLDSNY